MRQHAQCAAERQGVVEERAEGGRWCVSGVRVERPDARAVGGGRTPMVGTRMARVWHVVGGQNPLCPRMSTLLVFR